MRVGDVAAKLDPAPYKAVVDRTAASLPHARASLENAEQQYGRDKQLLDEGHVARVRLDIRAAEVKKDRAEVAGYRAQLDRAKLSNEWRPPRGSPLLGVTMGSELTGHSRVTYRHDRAREKPAKRRV